jgi:hypothetical protein
MDEVGLSVRAKRFRALFAVLGVAFLLLAVLLAYMWHMNNTQREQTAFANAKEQALRATDTLNQQFAHTMSIAQRIADDLSNGKLRYDLGVIRLKAEMNKDDLIDGLAVTFQPFVFDPQQRLYQYYVYRQADGSTALLDGATYDYTQAPSVQPDAPKTAWYFNPLNFGAQWTEPFLATGAQKVLLEYGVPFFYTDQDGNQRPAGVVTIDYTVTRLNQLMNDLDLGDTGYGFVLSRLGTFIAHPDTSLLVNKTIYDLTRPYKQLDVAQAVQTTLKGEETFLESVDPATGEIVWTFFQPIQETGWVLGIVLNKSDFGVTAQDYLRDRVLIASVVSVAVIFFIMLLGRTYRGDAHGLWVLSLGFSVICLVNMVLIWVWVVGSVSTTGVSITSQTTANRYRENYEKTLTISEPLITIPTGILVQTVKFPDSTTVSINGYIWQRYPNNLPNLARGVIFQDSIVEQATFEQLSETQEGDETIIVWYFANMLYYSFNPSQFPFDRRNVDVRLAPRDVTHNIMLMPDMQSYTTANPTTLPGIDQTAEINNWTIESSGFSFVDIAYNTDFGVPMRRDRPVVPELFFTMNAERNFVGPFIAYVLPGVVAAGLLFAFLLYDRTPGDKQELITALNYTAAIFFVIAVAHNALRESIAAIGVTYLEYLYILLYFAIVGVSVDTFVFVKSPTPNQDWSLVPKLIYLPAMTGILWLVTIVIFVY